MNAHGRQLAVANDYASLRDGLRLRAAELGISRLTIDHVGRLSDGHAAGLLAENSSRSFGIRSLGKILKALGVRLLLVEDPETTARTARLMGRKRSEPQAVEGERHWRNAPKRKPAACTAGTATAAAERRSAGSRASSARSHGVGA